MSRAHMLYDDKPLEQTAVETSRWPEPWKSVARFESSIVLVFCGMLTYTL